MQTRQPDQRIADDTKPRRPWVIIPFVVAIGVLAVLVYQRFIAFDALTYALRACQSPLTPRRRGQRSRPRGVSR